MQAAAASEAGLAEKTDGGRVLHGASGRGELLRQLDTPQKLCFGQLAWARMDATAIDLLTCIKTMRQEEVEKMLKEGFSKENMVLSVVK